MIRELNKNDYTVGQEVVLKLHGNASRGKEEDSYIKGTVSKMGRKILYIEHNKQHYTETIKIDMETGCEKSEYTANYILYDSEEQFKEYIASKPIIDKIRKHIGQYGYANIDYNKLKEIEKILEL